MSTEFIRDPFWKRFRRNRLALAGLGYICLMILVTILGPFIRPDSTVNANQQQLVISKKKPGFSTTVLKVVRNTEKEFSFFNALSSYGWQSSFEEIPIENWEIKDGKIIVTVYSPYELEGEDAETREFDLADVCYNLKLSPPSASSESLTEKVESEFIYEKTFLLGTDKYGRDLLSRMMAGSIISLSIGAIAVLISLLIGIPLGAIAGYYGGWVDETIMWVINVIWSIPTLLLVMAIVFAFGKGFDKVFIAVGLTMWVEVARIVRGQVISLRNKEFVEAGKALGYSNMRIIFRHIVPNTTSPIIVISAANFAAAILIEAGLSFLGIGAQIPTPSWGNMIKEHYNLITTDLAYLALIPGVLIVLLVLSFMLVGNGLRDALDVRRI